MLLSHNNECFFLNSPIHVLDADASPKIALSVFSQSVTLTLVSIPLEKVKAWLNMVQSTMNEYNWQVLISLHLTGIWS